MLKPASHTTAMRCNDCVKEIEMNRHQAADLDRHITGNYGEDSMDEEVTGVLSPECEQALYEQDMYSRQDRYTDSLVDVCDEEGTRLFRVSKTIAPLDLSAILCYGQRQRTAGRNEGWKALQYKMRDLLGAALLEPTA